MKINPAKFPLFLIAGLLLTACAAIGSQKSTLAPIPSDDPAVVIVGVDPELPPFESSGPDRDEIVGFDVDLMDSLANTAAFDFQFIRVEYNSLLTLVGQCTLDMGISAISLTDEQKQWMESSEPYFTTGFVVVVKKGNLSINGTADLAGMTVGTETGTLSEVEIAKIPGVRPEMYATYNLAFQELVDGYIDAVVADRYRALNYVNIRRNNLKIVGEEFGRVEYQIVTCKNRADLTEKIASGLADLKEDGTLDRLTKKWIRK